jgi:hypothetical protein
VLAHLARPKITGLLASDGATKVMLIMV